MTTEKIWYYGMWASFIVFFMVMAMCVYAECGWGNLFIPMVFAGWTLVLTDFIDKLYNKKELDSL